MNYYVSFLRNFPTIFDLAHSDINEVLKIWQGLGYYNRAHNLHSVAVKVVNEMGGILPENYDKLIQLKGIGPYTAAAISSISYGEAKAAVDGNVKRVASRIFGIYENIDTAATVEKITNLLNEAIINFDPGEFNQAMMELGAMICLPRNPKCHDCPVSDHCYAFTHQAQTELPVRNKKKIPVKRHMAFFFLDDEGYTYIYRRNAEGIWNGLYEFPATDLPAESDSAALPPELAELLLVPQKSTILDVRQMEHKLTHQTIFATFWHISGKPSNIVIENKDLLRIKVTDIDQYPLHRLMHRYVSEQMGSK